MDTIMGYPREERAGRAMLAAVFDPGDPIAGALARTDGPLHALLLAHSDSEVPGLDEERAATWRTRARMAPEDLAERILAETKRHGLQILIPGDAAWPKELDQLGDRAPFALWVQGDAGILERGAEARLAVTGSRAATGYGAHVTTEIAGDLARQRVQIVSGGQYGVDASAHRVTLLEGGTTLAVLPGGLDRPYPAGHDELFRQIAKSGLLLSELPPNTPPTRHRIQQRSRIMAALSDGVLVTEAGMRSSTLWTVSEAGNLNRPVGAVPGPVTSPSSTGCNWLIQGRAAHLIIGSGDARTFLLSGNARLGHRLDLDDEALTIRVPQTMKDGGPHR